MKNTINIEDSTVDDIYGIRKVQRATWMDTYPNTDLGITEKDVKSYFDKGHDEEKKIVDAWKKGYSDPNRRIWIAKDSGQIVGFCVAAKGAVNSRIFAIYVLTSFQRKGLGHMLMEKALNWLGNEKDIYVNVASYNTKALKFYEQFGFKKTESNVIPTVKFPSGRIIPEIEMIRRFKL